MYMYMYIYMYAYTHRHICIHIYYLYVLMYTLNICAWQMHICVYACMYILYNVALLWSHCCITNIVLCYYYILFWYKCIFSSPFFWDKCSATELSVIKKRKGKRSMCNPEDTASHTESRAELVFLCTIHFSWQSRALSGLVLENLRKPARRR